MGCRARCSGWPARCGRSGTTSGCSPRATARRPTPASRRSATSVPTAANGSVAPLAPDPAAQLRTIRALRDEAFDVLHLHEPLAPGPTHDGAAVPQRADRRHVPPGGRQHRLRGRPPRRALAGPAARPALRRVEGRRRAPPSEALGGDLRAAVQRHRGRAVRQGRRRPRPTGPTIFFIGRHEQRKGLAVLLDALRLLPADVRVWVGRHRSRRPRRSRPPTAATRASSGWAGSSDDEVAARMRGADVFCAPSLHGESFGVVLLEAMAAGAVVVASAARRLPQRRHRRRRRPADAARRRRGPGGWRCAGRSTTPRCAAALVAAGERRAQLFSMDRLAELYVERYERLAAPTRHEGSGVAGA